MAVLIETQGLAFAYADGKDILKYPDFRLEKGDLYAVTGHSGCGKTTFMHLLSLLLSPSSGKIFLEGKDVSKMSSSALKKLRGAKMGLLFQQNWLVKALNVEENIKSACFFSEKPFDEDFFWHLCDAVSVRHLLRKFPHELSGGERQRVALVKALIHRPDVVFADEPTSQADDKNCFDTLKLLADLSKQFASSLVVITHDNRIKTFFDNTLDLSGVKK
jgi:putative ABC transport system ATP-binding protein